MITKELLREWGACWSDEDLKKHAGRRRAFTPREIAKDGRISLDDRLWVLSRTLWYLDESAARGFAIETASKVAHLAPDEDEHLGFFGWLLEIEDLPESERSAAYAAAYAARDAAWSAAYSAARKKSLRESIDRALEWLGDYANGWEP